MFAGMEGVLLKAFCLSVDYQQVCCMFEIVGCYCTCPVIVIEGVFCRVCCIPCPLLNLIYIECLKVICSCHILIWVPLLRPDTEEAVMSLELMMIEIVDWFRFPLVEVLGHSML